MRQLLLTLVFILTLTSQFSYAECSKLVHQVKQASEFVLGLDYPYWYNVG